MSGEAGISNVISWCKRINSTVVEGGKTQVERQTVLRETGGGGNRSLRVSGNQSKHYSLDKNTGFYVC